MIARAALAVSAGAAMVSACVPSDAFVGPVAIRATPGGQIEALNVPCKEPSPATGFWLTRHVRTGDPDRPIKDVTVWHIVFDKPTLIDTITLGEVPPGAHEEVSWPDDGLDTFPPDTVYAAEYDLPDDPTSFRDQTFRLPELEDGHIAYQDEYMTLEEFADADPCLN